MENVEDMEKLIGMVARPARPLETSLRPFAHLAFFASAPAGESC